MGKADLGVVPGVVIPAEDLADLEVVGLAVVDLQEAGKLIFQYLPISSNIFQCLIYMYYDFKFLLYSQRRHL